MDRFDVAQQTHHDQVTGLTLDFTSFDGVPRLRVYGVKCAGIEGACRELIFDGHEQTVGGAGTWMPGHCPSPSRAPSGEDEV